MNFIKYNNIVLPNVSNYTQTLDTGLHTDVFVNYIDILFKKHIKKVCNINIPNLNEYFIEIYVADLTYKVSQNFQNILDKCKKSTKQFYIIPIHLRFPSNFENNSTNPYITTSGHSNTIIIDNKHGTIEFFEPHGKKYGGHLPFNTEKIIENIINQIFPLRGILYSFKNVYSSCPYPGVQKNDDFCLAWSLLFIEARLLNHSISTENIITIISSYKDILEYLKHYINYVKFQILTIKNTIKTQYEAFPTLPIINLSLTDVLDESILRNRIKLLLQEYTNVSNEIYNESSFERKQMLFNKRQIIFQELISYRKFTDFHEIFFEYFNEHHDRNKKRKITLLPFTTHNTNPFMGSTLPNFDIDTLLPNDSVVTSTLLPNDSVV
jgi:hypothetical protein